jgi:RNA polymerase sigma factor (sigma-70 family)
MYGMTNDIELLERHRTGDSDAAFADLVRRHVGWIHGVAARRLRDSHIADDVAQAVFILLHRKSPRFASDRSLVAWLHRAAWYATEVAARQQRRRQRHETEAAVVRQQQMTANSDPQWLELAPMLDELIERLSQADREAVLLRYYRQMSYSEVAAATGVSEEAARKRVDRAIEKLRRMASGKGVVVSAAALAVGLETKVAIAAPAGLIATTTAAALAESGAALAVTSSPIAGGISTLLTLAHAKIAAAIVAAAALISIGACAVVIAAHSPATRQSTSSPATTQAAPTTAALAAATTFPRLAPFDAVRWKGDVPIVRVENVWCELVAIDDLPAGRIVAFAKKHYDKLWQKRIEEDLVEVLTGLGQQPGDRVKLTVRDPNTKQVSELLDVPMTHANREQIWLARQAEKERQK